MTANVSIRTAQHKALIVPSQAVQREGEQTFVYVATRNGPVRRSVMVGAKDRGNIEIKEGISPDDEILSVAPK